MSVFIIIFTNPQVVTPNSEFLNRFITISYNRKMPTTNDDSCETEDGGRGVSRVAVKPPPFWPDRPALWFAQLDSQFILAGITCDTTKFHYAISVLDFKHAAIVEDIITTPPESGKYVKLKLELISRLSATREQRLRQLFVKEEPGDRTPSEFLRYCRSLAGADVSDVVMRSLWSSRLPPYLRTVVAMQPETMALDEVAHMADKVFEVAPRTNSCHVEAATRSAAPASINRIDNLERKIDELTVKIEALSVQQRVRRHEQGKSRSRSRRRSRSSSRAGRECWYHWKYGDKAAKCIQPCAYSKN